MDQYLMGRNVELIGDIEKIKKIQEQNGLPQYKFEKFMDKIGYVYSKRLDTVKVQYHIDNITMHLEIHSSLLQAKSSGSVSVPFPIDIEQIPSKDVKSDKIVKASDNIFIRNNILRSYEGKVNELFKAIKDQAVEDITPFCKITNNINDCDDRNQNAFHYATYLGSVSKMEVLMKYNVDVMAVDCDGDSAMHLAVFGQKQDVVDFLSKYCPQLLGIQNKKKETPLLLASKSINNNNIFLKLLKFDSNIINCQDIRGNTIVHYIARENNMDILKIILSYRNIDVMVYNAEKYSPIHVACYFERQKIVECICEYLEKKRKLSEIHELNINNESGAHILIRKKMYSLANKLIQLQKREWSDDPINFRHGSILHYAVTEGSSSLVKSIVEADPKIVFVKNSEDKTGIDLSLEMYSKRLSHNYIQGRDISLYLHLRGSNKMLQKNKQTLNKIIH